MRLPETQRGLRRRQSVQETGEMKETRGHWVTGKIREFRADQGDMGYRGDKEV